LVYATQERNKEREIGKTTMLIGCNPLTSSPVIIHHPRKKERKRRDPRQKGGGQKSKQVKNGQVKTQGTDLRMQKKEERKKGRSSRRHAGRCSRRG